MGPDLLFLYLEFDFFSMYVDDSKYVSGFVGRFDRPGLNCQSPALKFTGLKISRQARPARLAKKFKARLLGFFWKGPAGSIDRREMGENRMPKPKKYPYVLERNFHPTKTVKANPRPKSAPENIRSRSSSFPSLRRKVRLLLSAHFSDQAGFFSAHFFHLFLFLLCFASSFPCSLLCDFLLLFEVVLSYSLV